MQHVLPFMIAPDGALTGRLIFSQSASEIGDDVSPTNIISKLSLLVLHFPRLRIVWSRSLHATADIFISLKTNQDEPDENKAMGVGVPSEDGVVENDVRYAASFI